MALPLLGLLCFGIYLSFKEGVVSVVWKGVHSNVRLWMDDAGSVEQDSWSRIQDFTDSALQWDPHDPQLLQTAGAVYWWGAWKRRGDPSRSERLVNQGLEFYRRSIRERPAWPEAWLYLAYAKHWHGEWDDEFQYAYEMAWQNGSWRQQVIFKAAELGLDAWRQLTPENRARFYSALDRAALRDRGRLWRMAREKGGTFILCLALREHEPTREYCSKQGYKLNG